MDGNQKICKPSSILTIKEKNNKKTEDVHKVILLEM